MIIESSWKLKDAGPDSYEYLRESERKKYLFSQKDKDFISDYQYA